MKNLISILIFFGTLNSAFAAEYRLKEVCSADTKNRADFAVELRDSIIKKSKNIKSGSKEAEKFDGSDMQQWLKFTYPTYMPAYLYDAGADDCASLHVDYLKNVSLSADNPDATKLMEKWKSCLEISYHKDVRPMMTRLFDCYSAAVTPSK